MSCTTQAALFQLAITETIPVTSSQIIQNDSMLFIQISLTIITKGCVSLFGAVSNLLNIVIFIKLGLKDSMSIGLLALSLADFLLTILQLTNSLCYLANIIYPTSIIDLWSIGYFIFGWSVNAVYRISCWITVTISIERCVCVVSPFRVRNIFTRFRCVIAILIIWIVHIAIYIPIFVTHKIGWTLKELLSTGINSTDKFINVFTVAYNRETAYFEIIFDITVGTTWLLLSHAIVTVCAIWMGYSLRKSTQIRQNISVKEQLEGNIKPPTSTQIIQNISAKELEGNIKPPTSTQIIQNISVKEQLEGNIKPPTSNLTVRERRLLKVVLLVAVILTTCNIPRYITTTVYHTVPGMNTGSQGNLSTLLWTVTAILSTFGCSMNFCVYLIVNSKYRHVFYKCQPKFDKHK